MTESEAKTIAELLRELWPSRFFWTPARIGLAVEKFTRADWNTDQCEAVIRDEAARSDSRSPPFARIVRRCFDVHGKAAPRPTTSQHVGTTADEWDQIRIDRENAQRWYAGLTDAQRAIVVKRASAAIPLYASRFERHADPKYQPSESAMLMLKAAHRVWGERGEGKPGPLSA